jgi:hypothetical protein
MDAKSKCNGYNSNAEFEGILDGRKEYCLSTVPVYSCR